MDESHEHHVEFVEAGEDAAEAFEPAEEPLDLVSLGHRGRGRKTKGAAAAGWVAPQDEAQFQS